MTITVGDIREFIKDIKDNVPVIVSEDTQDIFSQMKKRNIVDIYGEGEELLDRVVIALDFNEEDAE